ncbi:MAG: hypothetical protein NVS9B9_19720 [Ktedonobacteraceae bacterium]
MGQSYLLGRSDLTEHTDSDEHGYGHSYEPPMVNIPHKFTPLIEKIAFLKGLVERQPHTTVRMAREALKAQFGIGISTHHILTVLRTARAHNQPVEASGEVLDLVEAMRRAGIRKLEIHDDEYTVEFVRKL